MSSFFTAPSAQRKRKRTQPDVTAPRSKRRIEQTNGATPDQNTKQKRTVRKRRDESISGSDSEEEGLQAGDLGESEEDGASSSGADDSQDETGAERRYRLAQRYLENIKGEVEETVGFDAADVDRDLIAERLKEDVAESKGRLFRHIAHTFDFSTAVHTQFRDSNHPVTAVATCSPFIYTVTKDITLVKWRIQDTANSSTGSNQVKVNGTGLPKKSAPVRRRPLRINYAKGNKNKAGDHTFLAHTSKILAVAASQDGRFVATGGQDKRLVIWSADTLTPLKQFTQHRDAITSLAFRRGTNQLFSASADRTVKIWSLDELAYVDTLFGHQDSVVDVTSLAQDRCVSVGARDRTARLWKVVDETQLVFRSGGGSGSKAPKDGRYVEGSVDRVAIVDEDTFITGSDSGALSLWSSQRKKPVFVIPLAHGLDISLPPEEISADQDPSRTYIPPRRPRWITALAAVPYSDLVLSGSWDGVVRVWRVSEDRKRLESFGVLGRPKVQEEDEVKSAMVRLVNSNGLNGNGVEHDDTDVPEDQQSCRGIVNDISVFDRGERGQNGLYVVAAVATECRLGRWMTVKGRNGGVLFEVSPKAIQLNGVTNGTHVEDMEK